MHKHILFLKNSQFQVKILHPVKIKQNLLIPEPFIGYTPSGQILQGTNVSGIMRSDCIIISLSMSRGCIEIRWLLFQLDYNENDAITSYIRTKKSLKMYWGQIKLTTVFWVIPFIISILFVSKRTFALKTLFHQVGKMCLNRENFRYIFKILKKPTFFLLHFQ